MPENFADPQRVTVINVDLPADEEINLTICSDLHIENSNFPLDMWSAFLKERNALPNPMFIGLGDIMDLVVPVDLRRFRPSVRDDCIAARDDWLDATVELAAERLALHGTKWSFLSPGNHEDEFCKRHGTDTIRTLARQLGRRYGGYSGYIVLRINTVFPSGKSKVIAPNFKICYHHGAWGGAFAKGYNGAVRWFERFEDWHIAAYGHCHQARVDGPMPRYYVTHGSKLKRRPVYLVNANSWVESLSDDPKRIFYSERHGYAPNYPSSPLVTVGVKNTRDGGKKSSELVYSVTT